MRRSREYQLPNNIQTITVIVRYFLPSPSSNLRNEQRWFLCRWGIVESIHGQRYIYLVVIRLTGIKGKFPFAIVDCLLVGGIKIFGQDDVSILSYSLQTSFRTDGANVSG